MKKVTVVVFLVAHSLIADMAEDAVKNARRYGAAASIVLRCVDQDKNAVTNAGVSTALYPDGSFKNAIVRNGTTDTNGFFVMRGKTNGEFSYAFEKEGYYRTREVRQLFQLPGVSVRDGRWQPYGMTNTVVLKRVVNPVAMYVATYDSQHHAIPFVGKEIGFDLFENDWVAPVGKGKRPDFYLLFDWDGSKYDEYNGSSLTFLFRDPYSGAYKIKADEFSRLKSPYRANTNAMFANAMKFSYIRGRKASETFDRQLKGDECLILRIRTEVDKDGNLVSAQYAKIYGPMMFGYALKTPGSVAMRYYLNPNINDPNLEADTTKNLLNPDRLFAEP